MPYADFGQKTSLDGGNTKIFKLTTKDQKVTVRILGKGFYNGKHFLQKEDGWNIFFCPRVMLEKDCIYCKKYFEMRKEMKKLKEEGKTKEFEALEKQSRRYAPTIRWYYPVINRDTKEAIILEVSLSTRNKIEEMVDAGVDVLNSDLVYKRTEKPGADYYSLVRKDSKETPELDEDEKGAILEALGWDIEEMVQGKESSLEFPEEI